MLAQAAAFHTDVPAHPFDLILVRPTATSITVSVMSQNDVEGYIEFGERADAMSRRSPAVVLKGGEPSQIVLPDLRADTEYAYRWCSRATKSESKAAAGEYVKGDICRFHSARPAGKPGTFSFTIQADSHLDSNMNPDVYRRALENALAEQPDFHIDLGDTFMTDKRRDFHDALPQYIAQRYYFGQLCKSAPLFMTLGNHDGEVGYGGLGHDEMAGWSFDQRTKYFPAPEMVPGGMYSGCTTRDAQGRAANYFAFEWGQAQFIILDPFWATSDRPKGPRGGGNDNAIAFTDQSWSRTLGRAQFEWLEKTLSTSKAPYRFVFTHHLVGGLGREARGGVEAAPYFEWGGKNADGSDGFQARRPGWSMPIHQLLVKHHVTAVFHGHDHLYVHHELDGLTYQCVPQPGNSRGGTRSAAEYGYKGGTILGSPGHIEVTVADTGAKVAFIRSSLEASDPKRTRDNNAAVVAEYELKRP